jgi:hypothetical protein
VQHIARRDGKEELDERMDFHDDDFEDARRHAPPAPFDAVFSADAREVSLLTLAR